MGARWGWRPPRRGAGVGDKECGPIAKGDTIATSEIHTVSASVGVGGSKLKSLGISGVAW